MSKGRKVARRGKRVLIDQEALNYLHEVLVQVREGKLKLRKNYVAISTRNSAMVSLEANFSFSLD